MPQKNKRVIVISEHNYEALRNLGTTTDSFDSVVTKVLNAAAATTPLLKKEEMKL